jgi:hypothetical protein
MTPSARPSSSTAQSLVSTRRASGSSGFAPKSLRISTRKLIVPCRTQRSSNTWPATTARSLKAPSPRCLMVRVRPWAILRCKAKSAVVRPLYTSSCAPNPDEPSMTTQSHTLCVPSGAVVRLPSATVPPNAACTSRAFRRLQALGAGLVAAPEEPEVPNASAPSAALMTNAARRHRRGPRRTVDRMGARYRTPDAVARVPRSSTSRRGDAASGARTSTFPGQ